MNVVDSSGWLEYLADGPNASFFATPIEDAGRLVVPALSVFEVFRRVQHLRSEADALAAVAFMQRGRPSDLTAALAIEAARLGAAHRLPLADAVIYATACAHRATLWTQDADFGGLPGVRYVEAAPGR